MTERLLMSPPDVGPVEEEYVMRALRSGWVAPTGPEVTAFEEEMATRIGVARAVALSSGTAALHLALLGVGVGPGDIVLVPSMTFVASANAVVYIGAEPAFVDVRADGNIDPLLLRNAVHDLRRQGHRVGAVMVVDMLGRCADYTALEGVCSSLDVPLIEDAAEALGSRHQEGPAGSFGSAAALSFNGNKVMTTSGGGMLLTDNHRLADHARFLSTQAREPVEHYEHKHVGFNYRMSNVLAALGRAQLTRLDDMITRRRQIRAAYAERIRAWPGIEVFGGDDFDADNCWLTAVTVDPERAPVSAPLLLEGMAKRDIEARPVWKPMHLQPVFARKPAYVTGVAEHLYNCGVTLPSGSLHGPPAIDRVCAAMADIVEKAS